MALTKEITIEDIARGHIEPSAVYAELDRLKAEVDVVRNDMLLFLKGLGTIGDGQSQQEYRDILAQRLVRLQESISEYTRQFSMVQEVVETLQAKLGLDPRTESPNKRKRSQGR